MAPSRRLRLLAGLALAFLGLASCGGGAGDDTIDREQFIQTYVDLRVEGLKAETGSISEDVRDRVLSDHGVTEQDLLTFADVHGRDVPFMKDVWDEVERRLDDVRPEPTHAEREGIS